MVKLKEKELEISNTNFIGGWYIDPLICDSLIQYFIANPEKHKPGLVNSGGVRQVIKNFKMSTDIWIDVNNPFEEFSNYIAAFKDVVDIYLEKFPAAKEVAPFNIKENVNIQFYKPGEAYYAYHSERMSSSYPSCNRHLAFMTYLNDVTDEGGTEFFHQNLKVSPEKGLTLIWPVDWTHRHRGVPSPSQEKYIITGWLSFI